MLKEKLSIERKKAVMITADFTAPTTESYAMAWLRLCNNADEDENRELLYFCWDEVMLIPIAGKLEIMIKERRKNV